MQAKARHRLVRFLMVCAALLLLGTTACGESEAEAACNDYLTSLKTAVGRCDAATQLQFEQSLEFLNCEGASVRDEAGLRSECLPFLESATCPALKNASMVPEGCKAQVKLQCPAELAGSPRCELFVE